ncbi:MAG: hypothetical protein PHI98_06515 [Eubacteriales bacterium]|nr:hypothetical protein [Eubacteriales bacterium]
MQKKTGQKKPVIEKVEKPFLTGSFCGKDAWKEVPKRVLALLGVSFLYFIGSVLISFDSLIGRILPAIAIIALVIYYQLVRGMSQGTGDVAYGEMMYSRQEEGKDISPEDRNRCYHPAKGFFEALMGAAPYVLIALVFAVMTKPITYALGVLPSWTSELMLQNEFGNPLNYYTTGAGIQALDILRIIVRAMIMPFVSVASYISADATLLMERLSPLCILIAPLAYGIGYLQGPAQRTKINTGIKMGDDKKRRKERKARKQRRQSKTPERLI